MPPDWTDAEIAGQDRKDRESEARGVQRELEAEKAWGFVGRFAVLGAGVWALIKVGDYVPLRFRGYEWLALPLVYAWVVVANWRNR